MAGQPRLVNKQFNSPIGLYSDSNVREILVNQSQMLGNGAVGIDFHNPMSTKPANLQNSAVLRMLEEEESRQRNGQSKGFRSDASKPLSRAWPPPGVNNRQRRFQDVITSGVKRVAWPPPKEGEDELTEQEAVVSQGGPQYSTQAPNSFSPINRPLSSGSTASPVNQRPVTPGCSPQPQPSVNAWQPPQHQLLLQQVPQQQQQQPPAPFTHGNIRPKSPQPFNQLQQQHQQQPLWAPVQTPASVTCAKPQQGQGQGQQVPQYQAQSAPVQQQQQQPLYQPQPVKAFEPPPTIITLRPEVPTTQAPAPIFTSQPATATLKGGKNLRGDLKWPPENVRVRMSAEEQLAQDLSTGPAVRPRKVAKDYSGFFAQHALNSTYPGYKIPPGTQYYDHHPVM